MDFDGVFSYSQIVTLNFSTDESAFITVFPNPVEGNSPFAIEFKGFSDEKQVLVLVKDINGKEYYSKVLILSHQNDYILSVDPQQKLAPGVYFVSASVDNSLYNKKLIVR